MIICYYSGKYAQQHGFLEDNIQKELYKKYKFIATFPKFTSLVSR
jgi:hypothetical protein